MSVLGYVKWGLSIFVGALIVIAAILLILSPVILGWLYGTGRLEFEVVVILLLIMIAYVSAL